MNVERLERSSKLETGVQRDLEREKKVAGVKSDH
jgi:hypothetical protein